MSTGRGLCLPATFRPQGLVTLSTASSIRARAGPVSSRRRSWDSPFGASLLPKGIRAFPHGRAHVPFLPEVSPAAEAEGRPTGPRFLGFDPFRSPVATGHVISAPTAGCSLGLRPSRVFRTDAPAKLSPGRLSRAFVLPPEGRRHRRPRVSCASTWTRPRSRQAGPPDESTRLGFRHRYDSGHSSAPPPGL